MNNIFIRELRLHEILKISMNIFAKNLKYVIGLVLLAVIPLHIIELFMPQNYVTAITMAVDNPDGILSGRYNEVMLFSYLRVVIRVCFNSLIAGGFTYIAYASVSARKPKIHGVLDYSIMKWPRLVLTCILFYFIVTLTSVLIFPAIYYTVTFAFYQNVVSMSEECGFKALIKSSSIIKGRFFKCACFLIFFAVLEIILSTLFSIILSAIYPSSLSSIVNVLLYIALNSIIDIVSSFVILAHAVWFVNLFSVPKIPN